MHTVDRPLPLFTAIATAWRRLRPVERWTLAASTVVAAGLLLGLVQACEESVRRGERLRAEQARGAPVQLAQVVERR